METNTKKRKKRKTRRCLDELRKKTQNTNGVCKINKNANAALQRSNGIKNNVFITRDRLTLFNNAVRSETVTRLQLSELKNEKLKSNKDTKTISSNVRSIAVSPIEQNNNKIVLETQKEDTTEQSSELFSPILINDQTDSDVGTVRSAILFSSESQNEEAVTTNLDSEFDASSSSCTINTNVDKIPMFVDVMDSIEDHIQKKYSKFLNTDFIEEMEDKLAQLCYEATENKSNLSSSSETVSQNILSPYSSPDVSIITNSRDYLGYSWTQPSELKTNESSPMQSTSSSSISIHIPSTSPVVYTVYDTPEYKYYPHKLN